MRELVLEPLARTYHDAAGFSQAAHKGQVDKLGRPYWHHPLRVAERSAEIAVDNDIAHQTCQQVGLLHDVIEDTPYDGAHLRREGFSEEVVSAVEWLTKPKDEPYAAWIDRLCSDAPLIALIVKLADLEDNLDRDRLGRLDAETQDRLRRKYEPAREKVRAAIQAQASPRA